MSDYWPRGWFASLSHFARKMLLTQVLDRMTST